MKQKTTTAAEILVEVAVQGLQGKKGVDIAVIDLRKVQGAVTDFFVICSGTSDKHAKALAYSVEELALKELKDKPLSIEGYEKGEWVLVDFVNVVVHVFQEDRRKFYNIEDLWADGDYRKIED